MKAIWLGVVFLVACSKTSRPEATTASKESPADSIGALVVGRVEAADGVELVYDTRGKGDTTLVFVHCWACERGLWKHQVDVFADEGYRVVTLDLGGHGESGADREAWTLASLGADVQAVVDKVGAKRVILVGHSMGGPVALEAAARMPGRVAGIACLDTLHDADRRMPPEVKSFILGGFEKDFPGMMKQGMSFMFRPGAPEELVAWVTERALRARPEVALPLMRALADLELGPVMAKAKVPIRCINIAPSGVMAPKTNVEGNKKYADFDAVIVDGVGHYLHLEKPDTVNAELRAIFARFK